LPGRGRRRPALRPGHPGLAGAHARRALPMKLKFWGVRGSIPRRRGVHPASHLRRGGAPAPATRQKPGSLPGRAPPPTGTVGNTTCLSIRTAAGSLFIDAGSGIRELGAPGRTQEHIGTTILFTHFHYDHLQGCSSPRQGYAAGAAVFTVPAACGILESDAPSLLPVGMEATGGKALRACGAAPWLGRRSPGGNEAPEGAWPTGSAKGAGA
jgi:hypothetical protein